MLLLLENFRQSLKQAARVYWGKAGAGMLFATKTRILLLHRSGSVYEPYTWGVVGGAVEPGEQLQAAAAREAKEELGSLPSYRILRRYVYTDGDFQYTTFIAQVSEETADNWRPRLNWENTEYAWVTQMELSNYKLHFGVKPVLSKLTW